METTRAHRNRDDLCQIRATDHVNRSDEAPAKGDFVEQPLAAPVASEHSQQQERPSRFRWLDPPEQFSAKPWCAEQRRDHAERPSIELGIGVAGREGHHCRGHRHPCGDTSVSNRRQLELSLAQDSRSTSSFSVNFLPVLTKIRKPSLMRRSWHSGCYVMQTKKS